MAGRGRGRGKVMSMTTELGISKDEILPPPKQPPPLYPPLEYKPLTIQPTQEINYLLELKRDFAEYMKESTNNVVPVAVKKDIERYSDRYQDIAANTVNYEDKYDWTLLPGELRSSSRKRKGKLDGKYAKRRKVIDIESKLAELEKKENSQQSETEEDGKDEDDMDDKDNDELGDELDDETDEGTDYVNSYFDNGESYEEEEDNADDGPTY